MFQVFVKELMLESHENMTFGAAILGLSSDSLYLKTNMETSAQRSSKAKQKKYFFCIIYW